MMGSQRNNKIYKAKCKAIGKKEKTFILDAIKKYQAEDKCI